MNKIELALKIALDAHSGTVDRNGDPCILHPLAVGLMGCTDEERVTGFLHDVVEDSDWTFERLLEEGIPAGTVNALRLLTHDKEDSYDEYLRKIIESGNPVALGVKFNDLSQNYIRGKAFPELQKKHKNALHLIGQALDKISYVSEFNPLPGSKVAIFACGCFWGVQHQFSKQPGVIRVQAGYTGGEEENPTYEAVRSHKTGHVEAVVVEYDPQKTDYETLCKLFFEIHDPAQTDGVGPDIGPQYRSCIFYMDEEQKAVSCKLMDYLRCRGEEVNTLLLPASRFHVAEQYHQDYYDKTGGDPYCHIRVRKFEDFR